MSVIPVMKILIYSLNHDFKLRQFFLWYRISKIDHLHYDNNAYEDTKPQFFKPDPANELILFYFSERLLTRQKNAVISLYIPLIFF